MTSENTASMQGGVKRVVKRVSCDVTEVKSKGAKL